MVMRTSDLAIGVRIPASMQTPRVASEMYYRQPLALEIAPIHTIIFIVLAFVTTARRLDPSDLQLDLD